MTLLSTGTDYDALAAAFRPIFTRIAQGAAEEIETIEEIEQ